jgi:hypothetical protein
LKTVCTVHQDQTYDDAVKTCEASGMKIFDAKTAPEKAAINRYTDIQYPYGDFWVKGKSGADCSIVTSQSQIHYYLGKSLCTTKTHFHCELTLAAPDLNAEEVPAEGEFLYSKLMQK